MTALFRSRDERRHSKQMRDRRRRAEAALNEAADRFGTAARAARGAAGDAGRVAQDTAEEALDNGLDLYRRGNRAVSERLGDDVVPSLILAVLAGYAIGWLVHGRD